VIDQLLEILENSEGIYSAFVLDRENELNTINEEKFNEDSAHAELVETLLPVIRTLKEFKSLNVTLCSFEYEKHTCNIYLNDKLSLTIIYNNADEFEKIEPIVKENLEVI
jgi:hypothetical protein